MESVSTFRKCLLLVFFCFAQFMDTFNTSALFSAIPAISVSVGLNDSQSVWLNSAYQLTFASFLLVSGRMSDLFNPKLVFLFGVFPLSFLALGTGFVRNDIVILVLRALSGVAAALTIPSSLHLLVHLFPDPVSQAKAVAAFSGSGAIGNVLGIIIGASFVSYATWYWIFWLVSIISGLVAISCAFCIPNSITHIQMSPDDSEDNARGGLDLFGVSLLTSALVLFIFAVTSGSVDGWASATVLTPLVLSGFIFAAFFVWEARIPEEKASLPPRMWFYPNFAVLAALSLLPYTWWSCVQLLFSWLWQEVYGWSAISTGVHFLPIGIAAFPFMVLSGILQQKMPLKWVLLCGLALMLVGTILLPFANSASRYWSFEFPAFIIGTAGTTLVFATTNIAIFAATPRSAAGTVGAIFNCGLQLGTAAGSAAITSIQTSVQNQHGGPTSYSGRAAGFWFLLGLVGLETLVTLLFMRERTPPVEELKGREDTIMTK